MILTASSACYNTGPGNNQGTISLSFDKTIYSDYSTFVRRVDGRPVGSLQTGTESVLVFLADGSYSCELLDGDGLEAESQIVSVSCTAMMTLDSLVVTPRSATPGSGSVLFYIRGYGARPVRFSGSGLVDANSGTTIMPDIVDGSNQFSQANLPPGTYSGTVTDSSTPALELPVSFTIIAAVGGCRNPEADNYNPLAAFDDGSCIVSPRVELVTAIQPLVANGRPVLIELGSSEIRGAAPAKCEAFIDLGGLGNATDVEIYVNGWRFSSGPILLPTNYVDADSLLEALTAIQPLTAHYVIELGAANTVHLTAREEGTPSNLTITTSVPGLVSVVTLPGVNRWRSQSRARFAVWLEVWTGAPSTNPSTFSDIYDDVYRDRYGRLISTNTAAPAPVLAQRIEMDYRADNQYIFDIAAALRQFTGHAYPTADGTCPDRLTSYFLKYGELYASADSIRRQRTSYVSAVGWALDAVEIVSSFAENCYLLSRRPAPWLSYGASASPTVLLGNQPGPNFYGSQLSSTQYDASSSTQAGPVIAQGRVTRLALPDQFLAQQLSASVSIDTPDKGFCTMPPLDLLNSPGHAVTFANGQGGTDTVIFEGVREEITKRAAAVYATTTGSATRSAQLPEAFRLNSGLLTRAEWLWLRRELGNTPAVWLEKTDGPQPIAITAFAAEADELLGLYTITIDCDPQLAEIIGLTN